MARELQDEATQNLVAIRRSLDTLATTADREVPYRELARLHEVMSSTLAGLRRFRRDPRLPVLDDPGLVSADGVGSTDRATPPNWPPAAGQRQEDGGGSGR